MLSFYLKSFKTAIISEGFENFYLLFQKLLNNYEPITQRIHKRHKLPSRFKKKRKPRETKYAKFR